MESLKSHIFQLITENALVCCLCFKKIKEESFSVLDIVTIDCSNNTSEIKNTLMLKYILGTECLQNLPTDTLCRDCMEMSLKCYKFIKSCKENAIYFRNIIGCLEKMCNNTVSDANIYKCLYLTINEDTFNGTQYYDQETLAGNCNEALKRLEKISYPTQEEFEHFNDPAEVFDDSQSMPKKKKVKRKKHMEDPTDKIPISDILYDMDNLSLYKCKQCKRVFTKMHNLKRHFIRLHAPKDFVCSKCNKGFGSPAILKEHKLESHSGKTAVCMECGKTFANAKSLKLHEGSHSLILKCGHCGKIFHRKRNYQVHVSSKKCQLVQQRKEIEKKYICDVCNKRYACKGSLKVHIQFEHGNGCHHICSWCGKKLCSLAKLKAHTVTHTQEKSFSCEICGGCFVTKESLLYHTRIHTGEKPYQCEHCDQRFLSTSRRAEHVRRQHMDPSLAFLECDVCHTKFRGRSCLSRHKKKHFDPNSRLHYTKMAENQV